MICKNEGGCFLYRKKTLFSGEENLDIERKLFLQYCKLQEKLINTYNKIDSLQGDKVPTAIDTEVIIMRCNMWKHTLWLMCPVKMHISLCIFAVWSVFAVCLKKIWSLGIQRVLNEDWSNYMDLYAD